MKPTPGQLLAAMEHAAQDFRKRLLKEITVGLGAQRSADHVAGFKHGWAAAVEYLKTYEESGR